jgi:hypothetical protein
MSQASREREREVRGRILAHSCQRSFFFSLSLLLSNNSTSSVHSHAQTRVYRVSECCSFSESDSAPPPCSSPISTDRFLIYASSACLSSMRARSTGCLLARNTRGPAFERAALRARGVASDPTSRVPCCAPCPTQSPSATTVSWIPPATTPRLVLQSQSAGGRGGNCAIIGPDGSGEAPDD